MENNDIPLSDRVITHSRRHWKQAYFTMRGWAFILAITTLLFGVGFLYAITRPRIIHPTIIDIVPEKP